MTASILIGTPCYGGAVQVNYFRSMLRLRPALAARGIAADVKTLAQESLISRGRNTIAAEFMGSPSFTHLLFIDADIGFPPDAIPRLLAFGAPVVAGCYPLKLVDYAAVAEVATTRPELGAPGVLEAASLRYPLRAEGVRELRDGFIPVDDVGAGFLLLERRVLETMIAHHGDELRYDNDVAGYASPAASHELEGELAFYAFFESGVDPETRRYLSEDYAFLRRWRRLGGEVWMDVTLPLTHVGSHDHRGHVGYFLERLGVLGRAGG